MARARARNGGRPPSTARNRAARAFRRQVARALGSAPALSSLLQRAALACRLALRRRPRRHRSARASAGGWRELPDDRSRFYADPFPIERDGRMFLFVEDFAHAAGYGVISVVEFDANGPVGTPRPVLDTGSHLSYPFVFEHEGRVWMVPESGAAGTIDLYRADRFPEPLGQGGDARIGPRRRAMRPCSSMTAAGG